MPVIEYGNGKVTPVCSGCSHDHSPMTAKKTPKPKAAPVKRAKATTPPTPAPAAKKARKAPDTPVTEAPARKRAVKPAPKAKPPVKKARAPRAAKAVVEPVLPVDEDAKSDPMGEFLGLSVREVRFVAVRGSVE